MYMHQRKMEKREYYNVLRKLVRKYKLIIIMGYFNVVFSKLDMAEGMIFRTDRTKRVKIADGRK